VKVLIDAGVDESSPPFRALGYKHVLSFLKGKVTMEEAVTLTKRDTRHYAKRQMTWFKKTKDVTWFSAQEAQAIEAYIKDRLN
jgi:tRNA dimethylallyltransferase